MKRTKDSHASKDASLRQKAEVAADKYTELYDFVPSGYLTLTQKGEIIEINLCGSEMLGKERSHLKNHPFGFFITNDTKPFFDLFLEKIFNSKTKETCEVTLATKGSLPMHVHLIGIMNGNGDQCHVTLVDISDLKRAEVMLQDIFEENPMSIQIVDKEGFTLRVNPAHTLLFGGVPPSDFSIFNDLQNKIPGFEKYLLIAKNGGVMHFPDTFYNVHDSCPEFPNVPLWIRAIMFPLADYDGEPQRFVIMHENITQQKQAEIAIRESEEKFRLIFENNSAAMAIIEPDTTISMVNKEYYNQSGFRQQDVIGTSWTQQILPEDLERLKEYNRRRMIDPKDAPDKYEFRFYHKNGEMKYAFMSLAMFSNRKLIASFVDITERKLVEKELHKSEERFRHISSTISDISYSCMSIQGGSYSIDWRLALRSELRAIQSTRSRLCSAGGNWLLMRIWIALNGIFPTWLKVLPVIVNSACDTRTEVLSGLILMLNVSMCMRSPEN